MNPTNGPDRNKTTTDLLPNSLDPEAIPPHDAGSEAAALCAMWQDQAAARLACDTLTDAAFYVPRHVA